MAAVKKTGSAGEELATPGQVFGALERWKGWIALLFTAVTLLVGAWNAKANVSDLEKLDQNLKVLTNDTNKLKEETGKLVGRLDELSKFNAEVSKLREGIAGLGKHAPPANTQPSNAPP